MLVILSIDGDSSTNKVIDWLIYFNTPYIRVNLENENPENISVVIQDSFIDIRFKLNSGKELLFSEVDYFFYRGGVLPQIDDYGFLVNNSELPDDILINQLENDLEILVDYFYKSIKDKSLGAPELTMINKLEVLSIAKSVGFKTPITVIGNNKESIASDLNYSKTNLISKAISETISVTREGKYYDLNTSDVKLSELGESFFPSLFQEKIERKQEIRVFIYGEKHYSISMQSDNTDIREDFSRNHYRRYEISNEVFFKCKQLLNKCNLNTGSFDFIIDSDNTLFFLEVNPIGQFEFVSQIGNYNIEYDLAKYLTNKMKNKT